MLKADEIIPGSLDLEEDFIVVDGDIQCCRTMLVAVKVAFGLGVAHSGKASRRDGKQGREFHLMLQKLVKCWRLVRHVFVPGSGG